MAASQWWVVNGIDVPGGVAIVQAISSAAASAKYPGPHMIEGPFQTKAEAQQFEKTGSTNVKGAGTTETAPKGLISNPLTGLAAIGDFFQRLTQASTWERIGEVVLGLILIAAGVAHMTRAVPIATKVAKTAGAAALI